MSGIGIYANGISNTTSTTPVTTSASRLPKLKPNRGALARQNSGSFLCWQQQSSSSNLAVVRSPQKTTTANKLSQKATAASEPAATKGTCINFVVYKDQTDRVLQDELSRLGQAHQDLEAQFSDYSRQIKAENDALRSELQEMKDREKETTSRNDTEFRNLCQEWRQTIDGLGCFTIDGVNSVSSQAELSSILKSQA